MNIVRIAIFEDNHYLREGLEILINTREGFKCVGAFVDVGDVLHNIRTTEPDVILMDIDLPSKMNGIEATFLIKEHFPEIKILIQTVFDDSEKIFQAIKGGASGYLLKNAPPAKLLEAIQDVFSGGSVMTPTIAYKALEMFRKSNFELPPNNSSIAQLTERQKEILECLVKGKSYKIIAAELFISIETVKFHIKNIYEILQIHSRYELTALFRK